MRAIAFLCICALPALAQQTASPSFDVASIRPGDINQPARMHTEPGLLLFENVPLRAIIQFAYGIAPYQLSAPGWIDDAAFTIDAKAADPAANDDKLRLMLQSLLTARFGMKTHHEQKRLPVFLLEFAKNGPKLHEATSQNSSKFVESKSEGDPLFSGSKTTIIVARVNMAEFASKLSTALRQPVLDRTGLKGRYDMQIDMTPYLTQVNGNGDRDITDPMSFVATAFPDQLGLKLEPAKEITDLIVVDAIDKTPSEN